MSVKETLVKMRVCDFCGKPLGDPVGAEDVTVNLPLDSETAHRAVSVRVITGDLDLHERCRYEVIAQAARQVGTRKARGSAAHKAAAPETSGAGEGESGR